MSVTSPDLSITIIARNEEKNLPLLFQSLSELRRKLHVQIVVTDTGSVDSTKKYAESQGAEVFDFAWSDDFSRARNAGLAHCRGKWILWLDADDRLPEHFWESLNACLTEKEKIAYRFIVNSPRDSGTQEMFRQIRLFPNHKGIQFEGRVCEQLEISLECKQISIKDTDITILHQGYFNEQERIKKLYRNFNLLKEEVKACPDDPKVVLEYSNCLYQLGRYQDAIDAYLSLLSKSGYLESERVPEDEFLRTYPSLIANAYDGLGDEEAAGSWFAIAPKWNAEDLQSWYWKGKRALGINNLDEAILNFRAILRKPVRISLIAADDYTIRRNTLGFLILCELQLDPVPHENIQRNLEELLKDGLEEFPIDHKVPIEYYTLQGMTEALTDYYSKYLQICSGDLEEWENYLNILLEQKEFALIQNLYRENPQIQMRSGIIEAILGKSHEQKSLISGSVETNKPYEIYITALRSYSGNPTLRIYFRDWVDTCKNYGQAYRDVGMIQNPSGELESLKSHLKTKADNSP
jgi:glycosyltransferase involved in cell wall biosynthesis